MTRPTVNCVTTTTTYRSFGIFVLQNETFDTNVCFIRYGEIVDFKGDAAEQAPDFAAWKRSFPKSTNEA